jgi:BirA family biotin operon repressor/biotin-[acetyl-CoA-carboxylase] ligase
MGLAIYYYDTLDNTNDEAKKLVENYNISSGLIITDIQHNGRGRFGNKWVSMKDNFMGSFFFQVNSYKDIKKLQLDFLNILLNCLKKVFKFNNFVIKEPNDILLHQKKISGILVESFKFKNKLFAVVGIGLNLVKSPTLSNYPTTSLYKKFKKKITIRDFAVILLREMKKTYLCS